jgi:MFS family permease
VGVLVAVAFAVAVGFGIVVPAIPLFAREFGVGRAAAGAVISAFAFARLVSAFVGGQLVDRLGERLVLALGIGIVAVSSALAGLAQSYIQLIVLRGVGGVGSAMFTVSALSLLLGSVSSEQRGRASGLFTGGFLVGAIAGPAIGGVIAGWSIRAPFFVYAATLVVAGTIALTMLRRPEPESAESAEKAERISLRVALAQRPFRAAMATNFADQWAVLGVRSAIIPLFVVEGMDQGKVWIGVGLALVALVNVAVLLPAGRVADTRGRRPVMLTGCAVGALALVILAVAESLPGYLVAMVVFGIGSGMLDVAPAAVVGDVLGGGGGSAVAAYQMAGDAGTILGPLVAGALADSASFGAAFSATAGIFVVAGGLVAVSPETLARAGPQPSAEGGGEVGDEVARRLDPDGAPDQVGRDLER